MFALFLRLRKAPREATPILPRSYDAQAVVLYAAIGVSYILAYLVGGSDALVTDATGVVWHTASIAEAAAIVSIYTMLFVVALATVNLLQRSADITNKVVKADTDETRAYNGHSWG